MENLRTAPPEHTLRGLLRESKWPRSVSKSNLMFSQVSFQYIRICSQSSYFLPALVSHFFMNCRCHPTPLPHCDPTPKAIRFALFYQHEQMFTPHCPVSGWFGSPDWDRGLYSGQFQMCRLRRRLGLRTLASLELWTIPPGLPGLLSESPGE